MVPRATNASDEKSYLVPTARVRPDSRVSIERGVSTGPSRHQQTLPLVSYIWSCLVSALGTWAACAHSRSVRAIWAIEASTHGLIASMGPAVWCRGGMLASGRVWHSQGHVVGLWPRVMSGQTGGDV